MAMTGEGRGRWRSPRGCCRVLSELHAEWPWPWSSNKTLPSGGGASGGRRKYEEKNPVFKAGKTPECCIDRSFSHLQMKPSTL